MNISSVASMTRMVFPNLLKDPFKLSSRNTAPLRDSVIITSGTMDMRFYSIGAEEQD